MGPVRIDRDAGATFAILTTDPPETSPRYHELSLYCQGRYYDIFLWPYQEALPHGVALASALFRAYRAGALCSDCPDGPAPESDAKYAEHCARILAKYTRRRG